MNRILISFCMVCLVILSAGCGNKSDADTTADKAKDVVKKVTNPTANTSAPGAVKSDEPEQPKTTLSWDKEEHDFGDIDEGDKVKTAFNFTNTGDEPLIISSAKGSCGCTVPKWPREPIPPGGKGAIDVEFNSKNKPGRQTKTVTIMANTDPNPIRLKIMAQVAKDPNKPDPKKK